MIAKVCMLNQYTRGCIERVSKTAAEGDAAWERLRGPVTYTRGARADDDFFGSGDAYQWHIDALVLHTASRVAGDATHVRADGEAVVLRSEGLAANFDAYGVTQQELLDGAVVLAAGDGATLTDAERLLLQHGFDTLVPYDTVLAGELLSSGDMLPLCADATMLLPRCATERGRHTVVAMPRATAARAAADVAAAAQSTALSGIVTAGELRVTLLCPANSGALRAELGITMFVPALDDIARHCRRYSSAALYGMNPFCRSQVWMLQRADGSSDLQFVDHGRLARECYERIEERRLRRILPVASTQ